MGGAITYVYRNGSRLTPRMLYVITLLGAAFFAAFGVHIIVSSGIRTYAEQKAIFLARYVTAGNVRGRRVYDTRMWNGTRWYRISSAGTVAVPGASNHEIQGSRAAVDLKDTGADAGILTVGSARSNWMRANAWRFGLVASGFGFREPWHFDVLNIFAAVPSGGGSMPTRKEVRVDTYNFKDKTAREVGRIVEPGGAFRLHDASGQPTTNGRNVVGGAGPYTISAHLYAAGTPGDSVEIRLFRYAKGESPSGSHVERAVFDRNGLARVNPTFPIEVGDGQRVFVELTALSTNVDPVTVTLLDSDAYLFTVA